MKNMGKTIGFKTTQELEKLLNAESQEQRVTRSKMLHRILKERYQNRKDDIQELPDKLYCPLEDKWFQIETLLVDGSCKRCPYSWKTPSDDRTHRAKQKRVKCPMWYPYGNYAHPPRRTLARR